MCKSIEHDSAVRRAHRDYLFMRGYAGLCAVLIAFYGAVGMLTIPSMKAGLAGPDVLPDLRQERPSK
jgi:hypothetical protein